MPREAKVTVTPLLGTTSSTDATDSAVCTLLECQDIAILLDCGKHAAADPSVTLDIAQKLRDEGKNIRVVLISHADMNHVRPFFALLNTLCQN